MTTTTQHVDVHRFPMSSPSDVSGLRALLDGGLPANSIVAVLAKTEGNGCVNDYARGFATLSFALLLAERLGLSHAEVQRRVAFVMSGGTEGVMSPHATVFTRCPATRALPGEKRLAIGVGFTRDFLPEEVGRVAMVQETARATREAMRAAGIAEVADVHFVQVKCPLLTAERIGDALGRGHQVVTPDTYESMAYSRAASALGVAVALGEVAEEQVADSAILHDWSLYSSVASTSAGVEILNNEIIVMGNSLTSTSDMVIDHGVMADALDGGALREALRRAGLRVHDGTLAAEDDGRLVNVLAKAEADPTGKVRSRRHTMLDDSDINRTRHARAAVSAVIASIVGDPMIYVSGGAEHQGPAGGGPVAVIARRA